MLFSQEKNAYTYFNKLMLACKVDFSIFIFSSVAFDRSLGLFITMRKEISHNSAQHTNTEDECKSINVNKNGIKYSYTYKALFNMDCLFWEKQT